MTKETALVIQNTILFKIGDHIPSDVINNLWHEYALEFEPHNVKNPPPCGCQPKIWKGIVQRMRDRVNETLHAEVLKVEDGVVEVVSSKVKKAKQTKASE